MQKTIYKWITPSQSETRNCLKVFVLAAVLTTIIFIPFLIIDKGLFIFYGDYNVQQIPFYQYAHDAIRSGEVGWSWTTDLGSNFVGSYSFYLLGSPFFWLTIPFPSSWVPYLMAPLFVLKFAVAATTSYIFIRRFTKTAQMAMIGCLLYAFSSFSIYNVFFNHFNDVIAFFPLVLVGLEELVMNNRKGLFALSVALNVFINYFFFIGQVTFLLLYFFLRCLSLDFRINLKKFIFLAVESVLGVAIALVLLYPSYLAIADNPRTDTMLYGFSMLFYGDVQRYGQIIQSFFFPADMPARANFFPDSNAKWGSVAAWLPLFSTVGVFTFLREKRGHWLKRIIILLAVMALIPVLNSSFFAFNSSYYARWFYMMILMMALATVLALENRKMKLSFGLKVTTIITLAFVVIGIIPTLENGEVTYFSAPGYPAMFWIVCAIAVICLVLTSYLIDKYRPYRRKFYRVSMVMLCAVIVVYSIAELGWGRAQGTSATYRNVVDRGLEAEFELDESEFYRIDVYNGMDNWPMYWQIPSIQAFHSIVPASIMEFYPTIGVERNVGSRPEPSHYGLRYLTSVKYIFAENSEDTQKTNLDLPDGFEYFDNQNGFDIYENQNFISMGFTYDQYITQSQYDSCSEGKRDNLLTAAMLLNDEQIEKYSGVMSAYLGDLEVSNDSLTTHAQNRSASSADSFETSSSGFTSTITLDSPNLVFFSVPDDSGWTATVNGEPVDIEKVNVGFMAVYCEAGENEIVFTYETPGLKLGLLGTVCGILLFAIYIIWRKYMERRNPEEYAYERDGHLAEVRHDYAEPIQSDIEGEFFRKHTTSVVKEEPQLKIIQQLNESDEENVIEQSSEVVQTDEPSEADESSENADNDEDN